jgi:hypothetical protein
MRGLAASEMQAIGYHTHVPSEEYVMAYDKILADRIRAKVCRQKGFSEKEMFGGICYMLHGNVCTGVIKDEMVVRQDPSRTEEMLRHKHVRLFDFSGRPMKGWFFVHVKGVASDEDLSHWCKAAITFAKTLPPKTP